MSDLKDENDKIITLFGCGGDRDPSKRQEMKDKTNGARTIPQIFIGDTYVGGYQ